MKPVEEVENESNGNEPDKEAEGGRFHSGVSAPWSRVLNDDGLDLVADIDKTVDHLLQVVVDFLPAHKIHGIARFRPLVEDLQTTFVDLVSASLYLGHLQTDLIELSCVLADV